MQSRIFIIALTLCLSGTTMLMAAAKGSTGGSSRAVTSTTYATFRVRSAVRLPEESRPAEDSTEALSVFADDGADKKLFSVSTGVASSEHQLQSVGSTSVEKEEGGSVRRLSNKRTIIVFPNN